MRKVFLSLYLSLAGIGLFRTSAQTDVPSERKNFTAITPNTFAFSKVNNIPTSYFTGQIKPSIPLYEKQMSVLKFSLTMDFIGGNGIKVDDPGSNIGRGWMLNTGGIVIRNIKGVPDDYLNVTQTPGTGAVDTKYDGMAYTPGLMQMSNMDATTSNTLVPYYYMLGIGDNEHDIFEYNFPGHSGKFYIGKDRQILTTDSTKIKIIPDFSGTMAGGTLASFTIIDETGIKYTFSTPEISKNFAQDASIQPGIFCNKAFASAWMLTKIEVPGTQESIVFNYRQSDYSSVNGVAEFFRYARRTKAYDAALNYSNYVYGPNTMLYNTTSNHLDIQTIRFSDSTKINFDYLYSSKILPDDVVRDIEIVSDQKERIKKYAFNYSFWDSGPTRYRYINYNQSWPWNNITWTPDRTRIHLESIYQLGNTDEVMPMAAFKYYLSDAINETALYGYNDIDYWGYHNGKNNADYLLEIPSHGYAAANRAPDINYATMGALKQIYYATGGSEEFEYELNDKFDGSVNRIMGGIRLKKRYLHDAVDSKNDIIKTYNYVETSGHSSGFLGDVPVYTYQIPHYTAGFPGNTPSWDYVDTISVSSAINPLSSVEGSPVGYRRVEEVFANGTGTNGKIVYEYSDLSYATIWPSQDYYPYTPVERPTWALGLPLVTSVYNAAGLVVKRTINQYNITQSYYSTENYRSLYIAKKATTDIATPVYTFRNYYPLMGRADLIQTRELEYADNDTTQVLEKTTRYQYNSLYHTVVRSSTANSMKDSIINVIRYPYDYSLGTGSFTAGMMDQNIYAVPIAKETYKKIGTQTYLTNAQLTTFTNLGNGLYRPAIVYNAALSAPVATTESFTNTVLLDSKFNYKQQVAYLNYDANGQLLSLNTKQHQLQAVLYDKHNNTVAIAANATTGEIAFTSFEPEENNTAGWVYNSATVSNTSAKTGYSYIGEVTSPVLSSGNYKVRFWAKGSGSISVNGTAVAVSSTWSFYTVVLNSITSVYINSNGASIDDIAISPVNSTFATYSYKETTGMTSQSDDIGTMNKFVYDGFNRLSVVKDRDENIRKQHEYKTSAYLNSSLSDTYSVYFCSNGGKPGAPVTYTVPANIYASLISQADADAKAAMDTTVNALSYVNAHSVCIPLYRNDAQSGYFMKQGCTSGYGTYVLYTVPKDSIVSEISVDDANAKAKAALAIVGQNYVNAVGACRTAITLSYSNEISNDNYHVKLVSRTDANLTYDFTVGYGQGALGSVITGTYEIVVYVPSGTTNTYNFSAGCGGNVGSGTQIDFPSVDIKTGCATITIY